MLCGADLYEACGAMETRKNAKLLEPLNIGLVSRSCGIIPLITPESLVAN